MDQYFVAKQVRDYITLHEKTIYNGLSKSDYESVTLLDN